MAEGSLSHVTRDRKVLGGVIAAVIVIWLGGAAVTKYSVEQMAYFAPIAVCVVGATVGLALLWIKIVRQALADRRGRRAGA